MEDFYYDTIYQDMPKDLQPASFLTHYGLTDMPPSEVVIISLYFALTSLTTIGFGDFYPVTLGGRSLVALVFYFGVGLVGFIGAILANSFFGFAETSVKNRELRRQNQEILEHNQALERKLDQIIERL